MYRSSASLPSTAVFSPEEVGWNAAASFGGSAIAFSVIVLFDNWLWPDPGEPILMESLGTSVARARSQLLEASKFFLAGESVPRPPFPAPISDLPAHMALLDQAVAEGASERRRAILLAAITRAAGIGLEVDRLVTTARENLPREIRTMARRKIHRAVNAIAAALDEISHELPARVVVGADEQALATHVRLAMDNLAARVIQIRPAYIGKASSAEIENVAEFIDSLAGLTRHIVRPLDEPPQPPTTVPSNSAVARLTGPADPALVRYCLKVGLCTVVGYLVGVFSQRPDLFIILVTVITTATPTYGATLLKMYLRIVGAVIGGVVSLVVIIIVAPNFDTLPIYMLAAFTVLSVCLLFTRQCADVVRGQANGNHFFVGVRWVESICQYLRALSGAFGASCLVILSSPWSSLPCGRNTPVIPCCPDCRKSLPIRSR